MTPPGGTALADAVLAEAAELLRISAEQGLTVRLTGSLAIRGHCPAQAPLLAALGRRPYRDIDLAAYSKEKRAVAALLESRGYVLDPAIRQAQEFGINRFVYEQPGTGLKVDVFFDELVMAHTVGFGGRLELDAPTIPLTDLLLTKLQIHEFTDNDLIDCLVLLAEHAVSPDGPAGPDTIDAGHVAGVMRGDWGFCYTAQANLGKIADAAGRLPALPAPAAASVRERAAALLGAIEAAPKTRRWKLRARAGTRVRWYEEVEDVTR